MYIKVEFAGENKKILGKIINILHSKKLVACVHVNENIQSSYYWNGILEKELEYVCMVKTKMEKFDEIKNIINEHHEYKVTQIIATEIIAGDKNYLEWIDDNLSK